MQKALPFSTMFRLIVVCTCSPDHYGRYI